MGWSDDLHDLVWGMRCAGCARPGRLLCRGCRTLLAGSTPVGRVLRTSAGGIDCTAGASYDDLLHRLIPAWKNDGRTGLIDPLAARLMVALNQATIGAGEVWVVPVPSRPESLVRRGFSPPLMLARTLVRRCGRRRSMLAVGAVVATSGVRDQIGLGRLERQRNLDNTLRAGDGLLLRQLLSAQRRGASILLVDDVVTTGATLMETARALSAARVTASGAVVVADTPAGRGPGPLGRPRKATTALPLTDVGHTV